MEGIVGIRPIIEKMNFSLKGKMQIFLKDGRIIITPINYFPQIKKLNLKQRRKWFIIDDNMFTFDDLNEVYHIEQILGKEKEYKYICK